MLDPETLDAIVATTDAVRAALEDLCVRGWRAAGASDLAPLRSYREELHRIGADHLAGRLAELTDACSRGDPTTSAALFRAQTSLRVFERVLTLETVRGLLAEGLEASGTGTAPDVPSARTAAPAPPDAEGLLPVLDDLARAVEDLVATGLTTASAATRQRLEVSFKEASHRKLLRLSAALRYVNEELKRFLEQSPAFSGKRFAFFLLRAWVIARGLSHAIGKGDAAAAARLLWMATPAVVPKLEVVTLGVYKRVVAGVSCSFDFRLRVTKKAGSVAAGQPLVFSTVFALKPGIPPEAYLHLPQPQKFAPKLLLEGKTISVTDAAVALDGSGGGRLTLGPKSTVTQGKAFQDWSSLATWSREAALARVARTRPTPLDLDVELQEEVVLAGYEIGEPRERPSGDQLAYPIHRAADSSNGGALAFEALVSTGADGKELTGALDALRKEDTPAPLFGLMHYERARLVLLPLAVLAGEGPRQLMLSTEKVDVKDLMASLRF